MARDRLSELTKTSSSYSIIDDRQQSNLSLENRGNSTIDEVLGQYGEIRQSLAEISSNIDEMAQRSQTINIRNLNDPDMENLRIQNLKIGHRLMITFKELKDNLPEESDFTLVSRMKRTLFHGLHQKFINIWSRNEEFLLAYETKLKKNLQLHSKLMNYNATEEEVEEFITNKKTAIFVDNILEDIEHERRNLRDLVTRLSELQKLEKSIEDVHSLFLRIQNLVIEQNEKFQVIEYHAQQATHRVDKGANELVKTRELQKKTRKKIMCLLLVVSVLITIFIFCIFI